ncbi:sensor histidine kinase [Lampropedia puyangensis]
MVDIWSSTLLLRQQAQEAYDRALAGVVRVIDLNISTESGGLALAQPYQLLEMFELTATGNVFYRVATEDGLADIGFATMPTPQTLPPSGVLHFYDAAYLDGEEVRVAMLIRPMDPPLLAGGADQRVIVQVAESLSERDRYTSRMVWRSVGRDAVVLLLLVAALLLGVFVAFRPLQRLQREMTHRDEDDLRPISRQGIPEEVVPLVDAINGHIARFTQHAHMQRQFLDDASHQLRTPLATLRTGVDYALRESDPQELRAALLAMRSGLDRAERVTNQMLSLAKVHDASLTVPTQSAERFELGALLEECVRLMLPAAKAKRLDYGLEVPDNKVQMRGMRLLLQEAILNLLDNAIKYTPARGTVIARLDIRQGQVCVIVEDSGPGMSEIDIQQAGVRFRRGAAGKANNGAGLGLAIVGAIVRAHQGEMRLMSPVRTNGLLVELVFFLGLKNAFCTVLVRD